LAQKSIWNYKFILADHKITVTFGVNWLQTPALSCFG
jgi:hypothetical protein